MTFGQGVADEETIPSRFCAHKPGWTSHNYRVYAYGPQQMWLQICRQEVLREFSEEKQDFPQEMTVRRRKCFAFGGFRLRGSGLGKILGDVLGS